MKWQNISIFLGGLLLSVCILLIWLVNSPNLIERLNFLTKNSPKSSPESRIREALSATKYVNLTPYIIAQAKHETGNFTSRLYRLAYNCFGMKVPSIRPYVRSGTIEANEGLFSKYNSVEQCVEDYVLWLTFTKFPTAVTSSEDFTKQLKLRSYFEQNTSDYLTAIKNWLD